MRDRRGPLAALLLLAAYGAALLWSQLWLAEALGAPIHARLDPALITLLTINGWLLAWRILMRACFTGVGLRLARGPAVDPAAGRRQCHRHARRRPRGLAAPRRRRQAVGQDPPHLPGRAAAMRPSLRFLGACGGRLGRASRRDPRRASRRRDVPASSRAKPSRRRRSSPTAIPADRADRARRHPPHASAAPAHMPSCADRSRPLSAGRRPGLLCAGIASAPTPRRTLRSAALLLARAAAAILLAHAAARRLAAVAHRVGVDAGAALGRDAPGAEPAARHRRSRGSTASS